MKSNKTRTAKTIVHVEVNLTKTADESRSAKALARHLQFDGTTVLPTGKRNMSFIGDAKTDVGAVRRITQNMLDWKGVIGVRVTTTKMSITTSVSK